MTQLVVECDGNSLVLTPGRTYRLGRDPMSDLLLSGDLPSRSHATLSFEGGQWILQDVGSQNGTYVGYDRVQRTVVGPGAQIRLGHPVQGTLIRFNAAPGGQSAPQASGPANLQQAPPPQGPQPSRYASQPAPSAGQQYGTPPPSGGQQYGTPPPPPGPQYQQPQHRPAAAQAPQPQPQQYQQPPQQQPPAQPPRPLSAQPPQQRPPGYVETMVAGSGHGSAARPQQPPPQQGRPAGYVETMVAGRSGAAAPPRPPQQQQNPQQGLNAYQQTFGAIPKNPGLMTLVGKQSPKTVKPVAGGRTVRIGRAGDNDIVVDNDLRVSNYHAELRSSGGRYEIVDVGSRNGTFVNGQRVERAAIGPQDIVGIGRSTFHLQGDVLMQFVDNGAVSLFVRELAVIVDGGKKTLLDHVSFPVGEKMLLAVIGPSGAGKSTLLKALTGLRPADKGTVYYDGRDLYRDYAELRSRIGLVPQDDVLHTQLTVRRALIYAAELRFPDDTHAKEREARVDEVLAELGLTERAKLRISALSGGQRKRVSVALELLTKPSLLFLDEPTSGLDPGLDKSVMQMLRGLADDGRTVITVTHSVANLDLCDRLLVLAPGGKIAFYGPPEQALPFLGFDDWADVFQAFDDPSRDWGGNYKRSKAYQQYVETGMIDPVPTPQQGFNVAPPPKAQSWPEQLSTLLRRYVRTIASDPMFLAITVALPVIMGLLARVVPTGKLVPKPTDLPGHNGNAANLLLILCIGGVLTGAANAVRELVKERTIYQRERAVGLSRSAYLASKLIVLGVITAGQAVVLTFVAMLGVKVPTKGVFTSPMLEIMVSVVMLSFTAMTLGLLISAIVKTSEMTMPLLVLATLVQVVFCGALVQLHGKIGLEQISWLVPSRWAFAAMAGSIDATFLIPNGSHPGTRIDEPLWKQSFGIWFLDLFMLAVITVAFAFLVARALRRHEPEVMRGR